MRLWFRGARGGSWSDRGIAIWTVAVLVFLFAPIVTAVIYSFNRGTLGKQSATFTGVTRAWYSAAWNDPTLRHAVAVSFRVAILVALISLILGAITGIAIPRHSSRLLRNMLEGMVYLLIIVPEVVLAISLLLFYTRSGIALGTMTLVAAHTPFTIAIVAIIVRSRVLALNRAIEDAAADLGAGSWQTTRDVILPQLRPALIASSILAFTFSFDDLATSEFLTTPTVNTLPVYLFGTVHAGPTPAVYAAASMMLAFTLVMLAVGWLLYWQQSRRLGRHAPLVMMDSVWAADKA
jgi:ABC-type spermidine/putrescine transport system permease subunit II